MITDNQRLKPHFPPTEAFVGTTEGIWPIVIFESEAHAVHWLQDDNRRHLYKAKLVVEYECRVVVPETYIVDASTGERK